MRFARHVYPFVILFPLVVTLLLLWFVETDHPSAAHPIQVGVNGDPDHPSSEFTTEVARFADAEAVAIALSSSAIEDPSKRVLYLAAPEGSAQESWIREGYPAVLFAPATSVLSLEDVGAQSAAGQYLVYGPLPVAEKFASLARDRGYAAAIENVTPASMLRFKTSLLYSVSACWVLAATALIAASFARARRYAIMRFWGNSALAVLVRELAAVVKQSWVVTLGLGSAAVVAVMWSGGWTAFVQVAEVAGTLTTVMLGALVFVHLAAIAIAYFLPDTLAAIRGRVQHLPIMSLSFAIRIPVALLLVATMGSVMSNFASFREIRDVLGGLGSAGDAQRLAVSGRAAADGAGLSPIFEGVGGWLREISINGGAVITQPLLLEVGSSTAQGLVVNRTYLTRHPALLADGQALLPPVHETGMVTIGIPQARMDDRQWVSQAVESFIEFNADAEAAIAATPAVVALADHQEWFTYGAQEFSATGDSVRIVDPIVIVVDDRVLDRAFYASMAGQGAICSQIRIVPLRRWRRSLSFRSTCVGFSPQRSPISRNIRVRSANW